MIINEIEVGDGYAYFSLGPHRRRDFARAVNRAFGTAFEPSEVRKETWRNLGPRGEFDEWWEICGPHEPGARPVTCVEREPEGERVRFMEPGLSRTRDSLSQWYEQYKAEHNIAQEAREQEQTP